MKGLSEIKNELRKDIEEGMKKENIPGLAISLVDRDGIIWSEGFGYTDRSEEKKVDSKTLFSIQSTGKTLTAASFLLSVQDGKIGLDDRLVDYYPEFSVKSRFDTDEVSKITFRHLLSHKAGLTHEAPEGSNYDAGDCTFEEHIKSINDTWLKSKVGQEYAYSNLGFDLVAYVLQKMSGMSFPEYVNEVLAEPLGIEHLIYDKEEAMATGNAAVGYTGSFPSKFENMVIYGAGCPYMSVDGLSRYVMMQLNDGKVDGERLIDETLLDEMRAVQFPADRQEGGYGLGLGYNPYMFPGVDVYHHGGGGFGFLGYMMWAQGPGYGVVVESNQEAFNSTFMNVAAKAMKMMLDKEGIELDESKEKVYTDLPEMEMSIGELKRYEGSYVCATFEMVLEVKEDELKAAIGDMEFTLTPHSETVFTTDKPPGMEFFFDNGEPEHIEYMNSQGDINYFYNQFVNKERNYETEGLEERFGIYIGKMYGNPFYVGLKMDDGNLKLYFHGSEYVMDEYEPGVFFTAHGESLEFSEDELIFRNIRSERFELDLEEIFEAADNYPEDRRAYIPSLMDLAGVLKFLDMEDYEKVQEKAEELKEEHFS